MLIRNIREIFGQPGHSQITICGKLFVKSTDAKPVIDASGMIALPGFVDCHTHTVYAGSRAKEYEMKLSGASYADLQRTGGGIHHTVSATKRADSRELLSSAKDRLDRMLRLGTTTVEVKSGYALEVEEEIKLFNEVMALLGDEVKQDIILTYLAHTVPKERTDRAAYIDDLVHIVQYGRLPLAAKHVDIFCDPLGFTVEESEKFLAAAAKIKKPIHVHGEQTGHFGGAKLAAKYGALSLDHGDYLGEDDIAALKTTGTTVVLLPGTILHLMEWNKVDYPALVQKLKSAGVPIAFATDFNPGSSPIMSMKVIMDLGLRFFKMSYEECLRAATINAARALGLHKTLGSIEIGKQADLVLIQADSVEDYLHGIGDREIACVIKKGEIVHQA